MKILHVSEIDNDMSKGTSFVIPDYVFSQLSSDNNVYYLNCNNIIIDKMPRDEKISYILDDNKEMFVFKKINPEIVIFHEVYKPMYLKMYKYCLNHNIPYIIVPHGCLSKQAQNHKRIKKILGNFFLFNQFIKNASKIQYLSYNEYNNSCFKNIPYFILGNGMNSMPKKNLYLQNKHKKFSLIYVGRYDFYIKGLDLLFDACNLIKREMYENDIKVFLYGKGDKKNLELINYYLRKYKLDDVIEVNGPIFGDAKRKLIVKNTAFIQFSRTEGQPLGIIEALSLGMPVLLSDGTGMKEDLEKNNFGLITCCNAIDISKKILELYSKRNSLNEYSMNSYDFAINNYDWKFINTVAFKNYEDVIVGGKYDI